MGIRLFGVLGVLSIVFCLYWAELLIVGSKKFNYKWFLISIGLMIVWLIASIRYFK